MRSHIDVFIASSNGAPSFNPLDSDGTSNAIHVEQLVGTLVRMHPSGRYEGYLAESWSNSPDFKEWTFQIKPKLTCEDGTPITGESFAKSLHQVIRLFKKHSEIPLIDRLQGYEAFDKAGSIFGIQGKGQTLSLRFAKPVEAGLLEYLALPFLGFYCENNFNPDGSWKDNSKIISSAAYRVDNWKGEGPVPMKLRRDWIKFANSPPESLTIHTQEADKIKPAQEGTFIFSYLLEEKNIPQGYQVVKMLPTIFNGIMISPERSEWLKDVNNRRLLRNAIKAAQKSVPLTIASATPVNTFYPHMSESISPIEKVQGSRHPLKKPLLIVASSKPTPQASYQLAVLKSALEDLAIPYEIKNRDSGQKDMMKTYRDPKNYDLQPVGVNIGGGIENQLIKFMFCSNLGVAFSDPSKRICSLVDEYEKRFGDIVPQEAMREYIKKFDTYVWEDAAVVPVIKTGHAWLLSPDLPVGHISPTMDTPYFDLFDLQ